MKGKLELAKDAPKEGDLCSRCSETPRTDGLTLSGAGPVILAAHNTAGRGPDPVTPAGERRTGEHSHMRHVELSCASFSDMPTLMTHGTMIVIHLEGWPTQSPLA